MEVVKSSKKEELSQRKREQRLKGLLYKKGILENQMRISHLGADLACAYLKAIDEKLEEIPANSFEYHKLNYEKIKIKREASDYIADFKEFQRNYEDGLIIEIQQVTEREQFNEIGFHYVKELADKLVQYELYGKVDIKPANVELIEVNKEIQEYIECLTNLSTETQAKLENDKTLTAFDKAKLEKELFEISLHLQAQERRLRKRLEYYNEQFLPVYNKDMEECAEKLDTYLLIAQQLIELNIDPQMKAMIDEYEKHKDDKEKLWLFFTALRTRLQSIAKHVGRNKKKNPKACAVLSEFI